MGQCAARPAADGPRSEVEQPAAAKRRSPQQGATRTGRGGSIAAVPQGRYRSRRDPVSHLVSAGATRQTTYGTGGTRVLRPVLRPQDDERDLPAEHSSAYDDPHNTQAAAAPVCQPVPGSLPAAARSVGDGGTIERVAAARVDEELHWSGTAVEEKRATIPARTRQNLFGASTRRMIDHGAEPRSLPNTTTPSTLSSVLASAAEEVAVEPSRRLRSAAAAAAAPVPVIVSGHGQADDVGDAAAEELVETPEATVDRLLSLRVRLPHRHRRGDTQEAAAERNESEHNPGLKNEAVDGSGGSRSSAGAGAPPPQAPLIIFAQTELAIREVNKQWATHDGTVGALFADEAIYTDLRGAARCARPPPPRGNSQRVA